ncbi:type IX secretion system membrane protein PorP/SprF [Pedobacter sp. MC2016-14]|uniref:PorP/SprF family type IX secretion system membrane protein n=1 Tax=Pedobacter sp. MC2016-14 TaxID=2897327 RepID=UPI001E3B2141|nr:type IX secretion system membrane protein PorP/SprF [Pedobacter sp. MC2016-14]MCD0490224.1 type IX secretion system membrane protein PorP/SprF [Pedobacter sp. MC2016-14]
MKRLKGIIIVPLLLICNSLMAQQDRMYTQYMFNTLAVNPAYAGSRNVVSATALARSQWTGIEGAPKTGTFTIDAPIMNKRFGIGLQIFSDKLGAEQTNGAALSFAYRIRMEEATLSFGVQGDLSQYKANLTDQPLSSLPAYDPAFANNINKMLFNFGTGVYYNTDKFYLGLSAMDLMPNSLSAENSSGTKLAGKQSLHLFLASGYVFPLSEEFKLKPSVLIKGVKGAPIEGDANLTFWIKDAIGIGAGYRSAADVSALIEIQATPQFRIGYSYDRSTTQLQNFNSGSHEIMIRYEFGFEKGKILSPRFF